jgi:hypothetical protein
MHVLTFLYPRTPGKKFDYDYHAATHLPLGIGLTDKFLGLKPEKVWIQRFAESAGSPAPEYYAAAHICFRTRAEVEKFSTLFEYPEAAERLSADWARFTERPPVAVVSEWFDYDDMDALVRTFRTELD